MRAELVTDGQPCGSTLDGNPVNAHGAESSSASVTASFNARHTTEATSAQHEQQNRTSEPQSMGSAPGLSLAVALLGFFVVTLDALEPFRVEGPKQDPAPLPYLQSRGARNFDIQLEVSLQPEDEQQPRVLSRTNFRRMYWNMSQQVAHLTSNGTNLRVGDLCGSGTISGETPDSFGSMLEICWGGSKPLTFPGGAVRRFLDPPGFRCRVDNVASR